MIPRGLWFAAAQRRSPSRPRTLAIVSGRSHLSGVDDGPEIGGIRDGGELKGRTMARFVEMRRHTDNEGDVLTPDGVASALRLGGGLAGGYRVAVSTGAQRATQTVGCLLAALGQPVPEGVVVEPGLRSEREDRWRALYQEAGSGELAAMRLVDPDFVAEEAAGLGAALSRVVERLDDGQRALAVGHSPT